MKHGSMQRRTPGAGFGQNGNYLSELEAQPGGPEGRPDTTTGSKPILIIGRPQDVRPRSLNSDQYASPNLQEVRREHPVPSPVSISRTYSKPGVQRSGAAGTLRDYEWPWFNHARYDGFGNLTAKVLNGTTTPIAVNAATNRLSTYYDSNGNMLSGSGATLTYDEANRVSTVVATGGPEYFGYDPANKRVYVRDTLSHEWFTFYGAKGEKLGKYAIYF
jgi:hypothetical protein